MFRSSTEGMWCPTGLCFHPPASPSSSPRLRRICEDPSPGFGGRLGGNPPPPPTPFPCRKSQSYPSATGRKSCTSCIASPLLLLRGFGLRGGGGRGWRGWRYRDFSQRNAFGLNNKLQGTDLPPSPSHSTPLSYTLYTLSMLRRKKRPEI